MKANDFWSLSRAERSARIVEAIDTGTCSVCGLVLSDGEPANGLVHAHWDCADLGPFELAKLQLDISLGNALKNLDKLRKML